MTLDARALERGLRLFERLATDLPELAGELEASARQYFRGIAPPADASPAANAARRRHLEWFLFERVRSGAVERPAERVLGTWRLRVDPELAEHAKSFLDSHASIFEVVGVEPGHGALLHDMAGLAEYPVNEPQASAVLAPGDLVVGRLYPVDGSHHVSEGAGIFRSPELREAIERDLARMRGSRRHPVLRIAQPELEAMFWGAAASREPGDPVGDARRFLAENGLDPATIDAILQDLQSEPVERAGLVPDAGDRLREVLERLAFETEADLDRARELLIAAWARLAEPSESFEPRRTGPPADRARASESGDPVRRAVEGFDHDRARGLDLDRSFERLERSLGLEGTAEAGDELEGEGAPDFPGVVGAVIEEFLWEVGRAEGAAAARELEPLRALGEFGERIGVLENLGARDLLAFAGFWLLERGLLRNGDEASRMLAALRRFCVWTEEAQSLELLAEFGAELEGLERSLPRVAEANRALDATRGERPGEASGALVEFREPGGSEGALVQDAQGDAVRMRLRTELERHLEPGDLLRVRAAGGGQVEVLRVYPPQAARLSRSAAGGALGGH